MLLETLAQENSESSTNSQQGGCEAGGDGRNGESLLPFLSQRHGECGGVAPAVRDADQQFGNPQLLNDLLRPTANRHDRPATRLVADFDVAPRNPASPAGAQGLEDCFLGCPATREMLRRLCPLLAVSDLLRRVNPVDEQFPVPFDHPGNPQAFGDVGSNS